MNSHLANHSANPCTSCDASKNYRKMTIGRAHFESIQKTFFRIPFLINPVFDMALLGSHNYPILYITPWSCLDFMIELIKTVCALDISKKIPYTNLIPFGEFHPQ
jgi:hypothetical protein